MYSHLSERFRSALSVLAALVLVLAAVRTCLLSNRVIENLEDADSECALGSRTPLLRFALAGA
jgi:hypothetical protein